jgi:hypothetical protein
MSEKILWIRSSADFVSVNNVSRETIAKGKTYFDRQGRYGSPRRSIKNIGVVT